MRPPVGRDKLLWPSLGEVMLIISIFQHCDTFTLGTCTCLVNKLFSYPCNWGSNAEFPVEIPGLWTLKTPFKYTLIEPILLSMLSSKGHAWGRGMLISLSNIPSIILGPLSGLHVLVFSLWLVLTLQVSLLDKHYLLWSRMKQTILSAIHVMSVVYNIFSQLAL